MLRLGDSCLWFDEVFSIHAATRPWSGFLRFIAVDLVHPPLYYLVLKGWIAIGGEGAFWTRLLSVVFSSLAVVPVFYLCRDLRLERRTALLAVLMLASAGSLVKYAQEARMYGLFLLLGAVSVWLFVRFFVKGKNIWLLTIANVLLVYTHYFGWTVVLAEMAAILALQRIKTAQILTMTGIVSAAFAPWAVALAVLRTPSEGLAQNIGWISRPGANEILTFVFNLAEPFYFQMATNEPVTNPVFTLPILLILFAGGAVFLSELAKTGENERQSAALLGILASVPVAIAFAASLVLPLSVWGTRHLIGVFVPAAVLAAVVLTAVPKAALRRSLATLLLTASAFALVVHVQRRPGPYIWCGWAELAASVPAGETVYVYEDLVGYLMWFRIRDRSEVRIVRVDGVEEIPEDKAYFLPRGFDGVGRVPRAAVSGDSFFVAFRDSKFDPRHPPLAEFRERGFRIGDPVVFETPGLSAYLVRVSR